MGHGRDEQGIPNFEPNDTENEFYVRNGMYDFEELFNLCQEKWPGCKMSEISPEAEHIHTRCVGYNKYCGDDYTDFICITINKDYFARLKKQSSLGTDSSEDITFEYSADLAEIINQAQSNWPGIKFSEIDISSSANHCMGCYVGGATTSISAKKEYFDRFPKPAPPIEPVDHFSSINIQLKTNEYISPEGLLIRARKGWNDENIQSQDIHHSSIIGLITIVLTEEYLERITAP